jgi:hypothetical protein
VGTVTMLVAVAGQTSAAPFLQRLASDTAEQQRFTEAYLPMLFLNTEPINGVRMTTLAEGPEVKINGSVTPTLTVTITFNVSCSCGYMQGDA